MKARENGAQRSAHANEIDQVKQRFEEWRRHRKHGQRIPSALWLAAVDLASAQGMERIAQALRLNPDGLAKRLNNAPKKAAKAKAPLAAQSAFVELMAPKATGMGECVIELSNAQGANMRVQFQGGDMAGLVSLTRAFWSAS